MTFLGKIRLGAIVLLLVIFTAVVSYRLGEKDGLAVMAPLPGNPAERAGIKAGDLILHIKDEANNIDKDTNGINLIDAVNYIRGKKGTTVILTIYHDKDAKSKEISLVRDTINVPSVEISWVGKNNKIAQIKVNRFGDKTLEEWDKAVGEFLSKKGTGVI